MRFASVHPFVLLICVICVIRGPYYLQLFLSHGFTDFVSWHAFVLLICVICVIRGLYSFHLFLSHRFHRFRLLACFCPTYLCNLCNLWALLPPLILVPKIHSFHRFRHLAFLVLTNPCHPCHLWINSISNQSSAIIPVRLRTSVSSVSSVGLITSTYSCPTDFTDFHRFRLHATPGLVIWVISFPSYAPSARIHAPFSPSPHIFLCCQQYQRVFLACLQGCHTPRTTRRSPLRYSPWHTMSR